MSGKFQAELPTMQAAAQHVQEVNEQIQSQLTGLLSRLEPLKSAWKGEAASDYQALQQKWNTSADDLNAVLRQISGALRTASDNYVSGEQTNSSMWQG